MTEVLLQYWPIFITAGGTLVWLIRLEGKVAYTEKITDKNSAFVKDLSSDGRDISDRIARIETKLDILIETINNK